MKTQSFKSFSGKITFALLILACCFGFTAISYGQAIISLQPATIAVPQVGKSFTVEVNIAGGKGMAGYQVAVAFDPTVVKYISAADAGYLNSEVFAVPLLEAEQTTFVVAALGGTATKTLGTLATMTFEVLKPNPFKSFHLTEVILADADAEVMGVRFIQNNVNRAELTTPMPANHTSLMPNYPNPFNPETWIPYQLATPADVTLTIFSSDGQLVRTLALGHQPAGVYQHKTRAAYWDGRNDIGERVASGLYFYTLTAGDFAATGKMLILK